jgi:hypothetical protein
MPGVTRSTSTELRRVGLHSLPGWRQIGSSTGCVHLRAAAAPGCRIGFTGLYWLSSTAVLTATYGDSDHTLPRALRGEELVRPAAHVPRQVRHAFVGGLFFCLS